MTTTLHSAAGALVAVTALLGLSACGTDDADAGAAPTSESTSSTSSTTTTTHAHDQDGPMTVAVAGVDYSFEDVPESVPAGSQLSFTNRSAQELHELVAFRLPDDVTTPVAELLTQPPDRLEATLGEPVTVIVQLPGADQQIVAVGDGVLHEPGRYALMCFIPIGADPQEYLEAAAKSPGGPPQGVAGGPPHFTAGMAAELIVE